MKKKLRCGARLPEIRVDFSQSSPRLQVNEVLWECLTFVYPWRCLKQGWPNSPY